MKEEYKTKYNTTEIFKRLENYRKSIYGCGRDKLSLELQGYGIIIKITPFGNLRKPWYPIKFEDVEEFEKFLDGYTETKKH